MIPADVAFSAETVAQILRMREWAANQMKLLGDAAIEKMQPLPQAQLPMATPQPQLQLQLQPHLQLQLQRFLK